MRAVVQRVKKAQVAVAGERVGTIDTGLCVFLGVGKEDTKKDGEYLADKIIHLRIFPDEEDKMNLSLVDVQGAILAVSQFTLYGDCRKGRRPGFSDAASPEQGKELYEAFIQSLKEKGIPVETGIFQADMLVSIENDGPVTLLLDSQKNF
ncbi:D-aminoacyl-tRNA deacylase [Dehalobacterium formicoaceticum]|uniref:D-aminoacyl-tRNA deacylase n=1 Tax=Dehalobacterium formicoaceticum TaxID=51515 RepID=A0ABT1Y8I1_9FIRM|nr:D-aminoacyl-tRNA deacylase [Dehalobacterium formicoaceticum]MCR6546796.1 D-aminoacyl-tRNA deacylase [Dehalobacterium formicoaceticum]